VRRHQAAKQSELENVVTTYRTLFSARKALHPEVGAARPTGGSVAPVAIPVVLTAAFEKWRPAGLQIGWLSGDSLFVEPRISYRVAKAELGEVAIAVSEQVLRQRLRARGLLQSVDAGRHMLSVRRTLGGRLRQALHLNASAMALPTNPIRP
jgi:hypothetical protein